MEFCRRTPLIVPDFLILTRPGVPARAGLFYRETALFCLYFATYIAIYMFNH